MILRGRALPGIFGGLLTAASAAFAVETRVAVASTAGPPLQNVTIQIVDLDGELVAEAESDEEGLVLFDLAAGHYRAQTFDGRHAADLEAGDAVAIAAPPVYGLLGDFGALAELFDRFDGDVVDYLDIWSVLDDELVERVDAHLDASLAVEQKQEALRQASADAARDAYLQETRATTTGEAELAAFFTDLLFAPEGNPGARLAERTEELTLLLAEDPAALAAQRELILQNTAAALIELEREERLAVLDAGSERMRQRMAVDRELRAVEREAEADRVWSRDELERYDEVAARFAEAWQLTPEEEARIAEQDAVHRAVAKELAATAYALGGLSPEEKAMRLENAKWADLAVDLQSVELPWLGEVHLTMVGQEAATLGRDIRERREDLLEAENLVFATDLYLQRTDLTPAERRAARKVRAMASLAQFTAEDAIAMNAAVLLMATSVDFALLGAGKPAEAIAGKVGPWARSVWRRLFGEAVETAARSGTEAAGGAAARVGADAVDDAARELGQSHFDDVAARGAQKARELGIAEGKIAENVRRATNPAQGVTEVNRAAKYFSVQALEVLAQWDALVERALAAGVRQPVIDDIVARAAKTGTIHAFVDIARNELAMAMVVQQNGRILVDDFVFSAGRRTLSEFALEAYEDTLGALAKSHPAEALDSEVLRRLVEDFTAQGRLPARLERAQAEVLSKVARLASEGADSLWWFDPLENAFVKVADEEFVRAVGELPDDLFAGVAETVITGHPPATALPGGATLPPPGGATLPPPGSALTPRNGLGGTTIAPPGALLGETGIFPGAITLPPPAWGALPPAGSATLPYSFTMTLPYDAVLPIADDVPTLLTGTAGRLADGVPTVITGAARAVADETSTMLDRAGASGTTAAAPPATGSLAPASDSSGSTVVLPNPSTASFWPRIDRGGAIGASVSSAGGEGPARADDRSVATGPTAEREVLAPQPSGNWVAVDGRWALVDTIEPLATDGFQPFIAWPQTSDWASGDLFVLDRIVVDGETMAFGLATPEALESARSAGVAIETDPLRVKKTRDPYYRSAGSWGQVYDDQWAIRRVGFEWNAGTPWRVLDDDAAEVVVALIDTGVDWRHPDLTDAPLWRNPGEIPGNRIDDDRNGYVDDVIGWNFVSDTNVPWDRDGHGTFVAGLIGARLDNRRGIAGLNPKARLMILKAMDDYGRTRASLLVKAIVYAADMGARVINLSVGGAELTRAEQVAVSYAYSRGALVVAAAGNEGADVTGFSPAALEHVLTVAATDVEDRRAGFSNWGPGIDLAAPGVDVLSLRARGTDLARSVAAEGYDAEAAIVGEDRAYFRASGTSFASPVVAGVASLLLARDPSLTHDDVERILLHSARDAGEPGFDAYTGYGIVDARAALAADREFFIEAAVTGVSMVGARGGPRVAIAGTARASRFARAWVEVGRGDDPDEWVAAGAPLTAPVDGGTLVEIDPALFRGAARFTLRVVVEHANGRRREGRLTMDVGGGGR